MAVKISGLKPTIKCPATLYLPADDGQHVQHAFGVHFRRQTASERDKLSERYTKGDAVKDPVTGETKLVPITSAQLLDAVVMGWDGMLDEAGQPVPYSHAERAATEEENAGLEQAMVVSWYDHVFINQRMAAIKNSKAPSATTSAPTTQTAAS
ncbi:MAG: hypothetical protein PHU77_00455 [Simplicispira sp.]|nr:hypothetical protein [Simplicispira sp.]